MSSEGLKEFKVNDYITMKLENGKTIIYVMGERFNQCKFLLLNIKVDEITDLDDIESIDEAAEKLDGSLERDNIKKFQIPPEVEFWGHCSNFQVWNENDYDTRLLHSNLAFPLLKKLTDQGDPQARKVFKEEITKRIQCKYLPVIQFLKEADYFYYLNEEEKEIAFSDYDKVIINGKEKVIIGFELVLRNQEINEITEIIGLENCIYLRILDLSNNNIKKITGLEKLTKLKELILHDNLIEKINGLENLPKLVELDLSDNQIQKIEGLKTLTNLKKLRLNRNQINKMQELETLINLQELNITKNEIAKIEGLQNCRNLNLLNLSGNKISKIENLKNLTLLKRLYLTGNRIKKIEGFDKNINLEKIFLSNNQINKIEGLDYLSNLILLGLEKNIISKIENLDVNTQLRDLNLSNNLIKKIEGLSNLRNLEELNLNNNPILTIEGLENLEKLKYLYLKDTNIPLTLMEKLGGYSPIFKINSPELIVKYCKQLKNKKN